MKIIQVINVRWYNATAWYAVNLAACLKKEGHECLVIGLKDSLPLKKASELGLETMGLPLNSIKLKEIIQCSKGIDIICKEFKPDIVNCHRGELFFLWAIKKNKYNYKLVRTRGDQRFPSLNVFNKVLYKKFCNAIISTNSKMTNYFKEKLNNYNKLYTIIGGVDTSKFYPCSESRQELREQYGFTDNDILVGMIGRLDPIKGFYEALETFSFLCKEKIKNEKKVLHFLIIGSNCNYTIQDICNFGKEKGIPENQLHCLGFVDDIRQIMCMLDVGLIASIGSETIARVALELIACNTPIIGSNVGVMPDILEEKYLFDPKNKDDLKKLLLNLFDNNYLEELKTECQKRFLEKNVLSVYGWTFNDFVQKTLNVYNNL